MANIHTIAAKAEALAKAEAELKAEIIDAVEGGIPLVVAGKAAGITRQTVRTWMKDAEQTKPGND